MEEDSGFERSAEEKIVTIIKNAETKN